MSPVAQAYDFRCFLFRFCSKQQLNHILCVFGILFGFYMLQLAATLTDLLRLVKTCCTSKKHVLLVLLRRSCRPGAFVLLLADCLTHRFSSRGGMPRIKAQNMTWWNDIKWIWKKLHGQDVKKCQEFPFQNRKWDSIKWNSIWTETVLTSFSPHPWVLATCEALMVFCGKIQQGFLCIARYVLSFFFQN